MEEVSLDSFVLTLRRLITNKFPSYTLPLSQLPLGFYKANIEGNVKTFDAYDGDPLIEERTNGSVKNLDLAIPHFTIPMYDWVLCLEVLEHIPSKFEQIALFNIATHARTGVVLSWAALGQGGYHHVNERSRSYVESKFASLCFVKHEQFTHFVRKFSSVQWLQANLLVFLRNSSCITETQLSWLQQ